jgi:hypothetical protein
MSKPLSAEQANALRRIQAEVFGWNARSRQVQGGSPNLRTLDRTVVMSLVERGFIAQSEWAVLNLTDAGRAALTEVS